MRVFTSLFARFKRNGVLAQNRQSLKHTLDCIETVKFIIALVLRAYLVDLTWSKHLIRNKIQSKFGFKCTYVFKRLSVGRPTVCNRGVVRWLEKCESKVRCHQISEAVLLWRWLIKEPSGKLKVKLNMLPCYGWLTYYFIISLILFLISPSSFIRTSLDHQSRVYNEFMMSADGWLSNKYGASIITTYDELLSWIFTCAYQAFPCEPLARTLAKLNRWPSWLRIWYSDSSERGRQSVNAIERWLIKEFSAKLKVKLT